MEDKRFFESLNLHEIMSSEEIEASARVIFVYMFVWKHVLPYLCLVGTITNFVSILVFSKSKSLKNSVYKYLRIIAIADFIYMLLSFVYYTSKYSWLSQFYSTQGYFFKWYEMYVFNFLTSSIAIFILFATLIVSVKRYFVVINYKPKCHVKPQWISFVLLAVSLAMYAQMPYVRSITRIDNNASNLTTNELPHTVYKKAYNQNL